MTKKSRSFLKYTVTITFALAAYVFVLKAEFSKITPNEGVDSYSKLKLQNVTMTQAMRISNPPDHICIFGDVNYSMWTFPSGPPAYIFDQSGNLVTYTLDTGENPKFKQEYLAGSNKKITISEAEELFEQSRLKQIAEDTAPNP